MQEKGFWNILCTEFNYRLYAGVPVLGHGNLYDTMDSEIMHFVPAINESIALGIVTGGFLSGYKGCVLMDANNFDLILHQFKQFNIMFNIPVLFIVTGGYNPLNLHKFEFNNDLTILNKIDFYMKKYNKSSILVYNEIVL